jgi:hypothetical protein
MNLMQSPVVYKYKARFVFMEGEVSSQIGCRGLQDDAWIKEAPNSFSSALPQMLPGGKARLLSRMERYIGPSCIKRQAKSGRDKTRNFAGEP